MNEVDWLTGSDLPAMLAYLDGRASDRKFRLFACACVRRHWPLLRYRAPREAVVLAERFAEGEATASQLETARGHAEQWAADAPMFDQPTYMAAFATLAEQGPESAREACEAIRQQAVRLAASEATPGEDEASLNQEASRAEQLAQADLLREIIGNPFRTVAIDPTWLGVSSGAAGSLTRMIAEEGRYAEMPYLADALFDAGCSDEALLRHLRSPTGHVRGCWALDALMGRS